MESHYFKDIAPKMSLLASADSSEEAIAVLKQIIASLGYESEVVSGPELPHEGSNVTFRIAPSAAPHWTIEAKMAGGIARAHSPEAEALARIACELFGAVVAAVEFRSRVAALDEQLRAAISTLHHDIRTPLTSIAGMAQTLLMRPGVEDAVKTEFLERIETSAEAITAMTDEFRARIDALLTVANLPPETTRLDEAFKSAIAKAVSKGAEITVVSAPQGSISVRTPPNVVDEILDGVFAHFTAVLAGRAVAVLREESTRAPARSDTNPVARAILKGPAYPGYSLPSDLSKIWVPEGALLSSEQPQKLARPYHLCQAAGGSLQVYKDRDELVLEIELPMSA
ncbi:MAG: hypothetical protein C4317_06265 [Acidimicrobiia bacterium]